MSLSRSDQRIFVDSSAYYATIDRRDADHAPAAATMQRLARERRTLVTTNAVLFELHALLVNRVNRKTAWDALVALRASQTIVRVRSADERRAEEILAQYDDKDFSLTDTLSFAVMERLGIQEAFSLDQHFAQFSWQLIPLETDPTT